MRQNLVQLDRDHPGFRDTVYRERRDTIARIAMGHTTGQPVPEAPYSTEEHGVWRTITDVLWPMHEQLVCSELLALSRRLELPTDRIPQLEQVNERLSHVGWRMEPVAGLVEARAFLESLADQVFCSTQYIRHASRPFYTPEPDVVHELVGHAASLLHPGIRATSARFGRCARLASDDEIERLTRVYWYTLEFGLVDEGGRPRAIGAGLLSSIGELERSVQIGGIRRPTLDVDALADTPYDPTDFQPFYSVGPGLDGTLAALDAWLDAGGWRIERSYRQPSSSGLPSHSA